MKDKQLLGVVLAVVGIIMFSAKAVMVKMAYQYDVDALSLLMFRMLFALPVYLIILFSLSRSPGPQLRRKDYVWLVIFGFLGYYVSSYLDFVGLVYIKASLERIILFIYPTLILLISRIFMGVRITRWQIIAIVITYLGICITFIDEFSFTDSESLYLGGGLVFMAAVTYATYLVGSGWLIPKFGSVRFTAYAMVLACGFVIAHNAVQNDADLLSFSPEVYWLGLAMAIFATVVPSFLVSESIKHIGASNFGIIGSIGPISTIIMARIFLDERMTATQIFGTLIVIAGVLVVVGKKKKLVNPIPTPKTDS